MCLVLSILLLSSFTFFAKCGEVWAVNKAESGISNKAISAYFEEINTVEQGSFPSISASVVDSLEVNILQEVDAIFIQGLKKWELYDQVWQAGAIFLPVNSVGVMGDERTYENCVALRAVQSTDGMTADWVDLPYAFLQKISNEIINNVKGINRVVYDISSKPPATIEWE